MAEIDGGKVNFFIRIPSASWARLHLYIPSQIPLLFKERIPDIVYLHVSNGDVFEVKYNPYCACFVGLTKLFERYSLRSYDFLFFEYCGGLRFEVIIISSNTTEICYPSVPNFYSQSEVVEHSISIEEPTVSVVGRPLLDDLSGALLCTTRYGGGIDQFKIIIARSCVEQPGAVVIPCEKDFFGLDLPNSFHVFLHFLERGWEVVVQQSPAHLLFTDGWLKFAFDVGLEVGDLCVFQRRISKHGFVVGVYKNFKATILKHQEGDNKPSCFMKIIDDAAIIDGEIYIPHVFSEAYSHMIPLEVVVRTAKDEVFIAEYDVQRSVLRGLKELIVAEALFVRQVVLFFYRGDGVFSLRIFNSNSCDIVAG